MVKNIFTLCKKNKINMLITVIVLAVFIFSSSIALTIVFNTIYEVIDNNEINKNRIDIEVIFNKDTTLHKIEEDILSKVNGQITLPLGRVIVNEKKSGELIAINSNEEFDIGINIMDGNTFSKDELFEKKVMIGKFLESEIYNVDESDYIKIGNEDYQVIGVIGSENLNSAYDLATYIPIKKIPQKIQESTFGNIKFSVYDISEDDITNVLQNLDFVDGYSAIKKDNTGFLSIFMKNYSYNIDYIIGLIVTLIIALINMVISANIWVESQIHDVAIKKVMGASNKKIMLDFFMINIVFTIISSGIAMILKRIFSNIIWNYFFIDISLVANNSIYSIIMAFVVSLGVTLHQIKRVTKVPLVNFIKE